MNRYDGLTDELDEEGKYILFTDHEAAIKKAVEDEREACLNIIDEFLDVYSCYQPGLSDAIRQRSAQN